MAYNKFTAALIAGAVTTIIGAFWHADATVMQAVQTLITAGLVFAVPNIQPGD